MKSLLLSSALLLASLPAVHAADAPAAQETTAAKRHPVKGVVQSLLPERNSVLVKHEEVPGVMRAMTMSFRVDPAVLQQVKTGDVITALMARESDGWWLHEVKVVPAEKK